MATAAAPGVSLAGHAVPEIVLARLPTILGVCAERDADPAGEPALRRAFADVLRGVKAANPHTPLLVLSTLAANLDVLAVEEAASQGIPVIACLPMPPEACEQSFSGSGLERFRSALTRCARTTVVARTPHRESSLFAASMFVAHYSHLLVAFWDGNETHGLADPSHMVRIRLTGRTKDEVAGIPELPDIGPVYQIVTPRASEVPSPATRAVVAHFPRRFHGDVHAERDFLSSLRQLDNLNADLEREHAERGEEPNLKMLLNSTNAIANRLQSRTLRFLHGLYAFGFIAAAAQIMVNGNIVKIAALAVAGVAYWLARRFNFESRYQDYRALAEGFRVQNAWYACGLRGERVENCYLRMQQSELQWIRMALRSAHLLFCTENTAAPWSAENAELQEWLVGQWQYYHSAGVRDGRTVRRLKRIAAIALWTGITACGLFVTLSFMYKTPPVPAFLSEATAMLASSCPKDASQLGKVVASSLSFCEKNGKLVSFSDMAWWLSLIGLALCGMLATLLNSYAEKRHFAANAKRYNRMFLLFDRVRGRLNGPRKVHVEEQESLVRELGREALVEHADWLLARRERPLGALDV